MIKLDTSKRIANNAFGGADFMKVQSQHDRLLREIQHLSEAEQIKEMINAVNYLMANKSDYWFEVAHIFNEIFRDRSDQNKPRYKIAEPTLTKKEFCEKYFMLSYKTIREYLKIVKETEKYKIPEELIRTLGFNNTNIIIKSGNACTLEKYDMSRLEELLRNQTSRRSYLLEVRRYWKKLTDEERKEFLREVGD